MIANNDWLKNLKRGDVVAVHGARDLDLRVVSRTTATLIVLNDNEHDRYRRSDGSKTPRVQFYHRWIREATDADRAAVYARLSRRF